MKNVNIIIIVESTVAHSLNEHVSNLSKLAVFLILHFNKAPLGLSAKDPLATNAHLLVTANDSKRYELLKKWSSNTGEKRLKIIYLNFVVYGRFFFIVIIITRGIYPYVVESKILTNLIKIQINIREIV